MLSSASLPLEWETGRRKTVFPVLKGPPFRPMEHGQLAQSMTYSQLFETSIIMDDDTGKRKNRWKLMRRFFELSQSPPFRMHSFERSLYTNAQFIIREELFVRSVVAEYKFPNKLNADLLLSRLYLSFDRERGNSVDWRVVLLHYKILMYARFVRNRPKDLSLILSDIFSDGNGEPIAHRDGFQIRDPIQVLEHIFTAPCETSNELMRIKTLLTPINDILSSQGQLMLIERKRLANVLGDNDELLRFWSSLLWERLSTDLRLQVLDEAQLMHRDNAERIVSRFKSEQALMLYKRNTTKTFFRGWKVYSMQSTGLRAYTHKKLKRKVTRFFRFWHKLALRNGLKRKRRSLAAALGALAIKSRSFARIKLFLQNRRRIESAAGSTHKKGRLFKLAGTHLREFRRLHSIRLFYHRWWNRCVALNNREVAEGHNRLRLQRRVFVSWHQYAAQAAEEERQSVIARENKLQLDRRLQDAEEATKLLLRLEREREDRRKAAEEQQARDEKQLRMQQARERVRREREEERMVLLKIQREERRKRVAQDIKVLKAMFKKDFDVLAKDMLERIRERTTNYIENPDNKLALDMKVAQLKKEFFANPSPETRERERVLSSLRNILLLFVEAKLREQDLQLQDLFKRFDTNAKGYLTYDEFAMCIRSLKTGLSESKIQSAIRSVDADKDGYIALDELVGAMKELDLMGVPGSPWKMYVDPAEDVICYHNFTTGEKILEYKMQDETLRAIMIANLYGEAQNTTEQEIRALRESNWKETLQGYMVRRLQYLFRQWKGRRWRKKRQWKAQKRVLRDRTDKQRLCVKFIERFVMGNKSRARFKKQLLLSIEKLYDNDSKQMFYYNYQTGESSWVRPRILSRYGECTKPCPWIPLEQTQVESNTALIAHGDQRQTHYYHVIAKRSFPGKPDGYTACSRCQHLLAIHKCKECNQQFCFRCHRETHAHPMGFFQNTKARKEQYTDPDFILRITNFSHEWTESDLIRCQLCKTSKIYAAFHCDDCEMNICRQCSNRLHSTGGAKNHRYYNI